MAYAAGGLVDALHQRRSIRLYTAEPVPRDLIEQVVAAAHAAPSNWNRQPWAMIVADDPDAREWLLSTLGDALRHVESIAQSDDTTLFHLVDHTRTWLHPLGEAPALVLTFWKPSPERFERRIAELLATGGVELWNPNLISFGMAMQNMLLAAHALGLGACMHSGPVPFLRGRVNRALRLPPNLQLAGVVTLGYPAEAPPCPGRRPLERVLSWVDARTLRRDK